MLLIHSSQIPECYLTKLRAASPGINRYLPLWPRTNIYKSISTHPDIFFTLLGDTLIFCKTIDGPLLSSIGSYRSKIAPSGSEPHGSYPETASLSILNIGGYLIHNTRITDKTVLSRAKAMNLELIHVNQGYARCSAIPVGQNSIITSDNGIAQALSKTQINCLLISSDSIILPGQKNGFIGGASGILPNGDIVFIGDLKTHKDHDMIVSFLKRHNVHHYSLSGLPLFDAGSLLFIK